MTLIISLGNDEQFVQLSDRRISMDHEVKDEETNKAGRFRSNDGRFMYGYTGLAETNNKWGPRFEAYKWIMDTLNICNRLERNINEILNLFTLSATEYFKNSKLLSSLKAEDKRFSILFSGYIDTFDPPLGVCALISNFRDPINNVESPIASVEFKKYLQEEPSRVRGQFHFVNIIGNWPLVKKEHESILREMTRNHKPASAIRDKALSLIREISDDSEFTVGKQVSSIILPRDPFASYDEGYHSAVNTHTTHMPDQLVPGQNPISIVGMRLDVAEPDKSNISHVMKVKPRKPCPCGSGRRYKNCHGKRQK